MAFFKQLPLQSAAAVSKICFVFIYIVLYVQEK